ncbi:MAG: hypothetical protein EDS66_05245 [Planctomycetota bacterium]|nr:MAG: hypothetical protein EDS66_05245 [Planctomycetota bacterium]KAB2949421.1 MAG: PQQ-binding-like beta-propeller repeat protein [Phycisphaerae bacterium]MCQ3920900.1 hypothetical protein [Planctomycetota bacterium]
MFTTGCSGKADETKAPRSAPPVFARLRNPRRRLHTWMAWGMITVVAVCSVPSVAQDRPQDILIEFLTPRHSDADGRAAQPDSDPTSVTFLQRAEDAIARGDWKLAIDSLQRNVTEGGRVLCKREPSRQPDDASRLKDTTLFESARRQALRRMRSFDARGREAYELLYSGMVSGLLAAAETKGDEAPLVTATSAYPLCKASVDAFDELSSRQLDSGRAAAAITTLEELALWHPEAAAAPRLRLRMAAALTLAGRQVEARRVVREVLERPDLDEGARAAAEDLSTWAASLNLIARDSAPHNGDRHTSVGIQQATGASLSSPAPWALSLTDDLHSRWDYIRLACRAWTLPLPPVLNTAQDAEQFFVRTADGCLALNLSTLQRSWTWRETDWPQRTSGVNPAGSPTEILGRWIAESSVDALGASITAYEGRVYVLERRPAQSGENYLIQRLRRGMIDVDPDSDTALDWVGGLPRRLVALDASTGTELWSLNADGRATDPFHDLCFLGPPLGVGGALWLLYAQGNDIYLAVVDAERGELADRMHLCSAEGLDAGRGAALHCTTDGERVYAQTGRGLLAAIHAQRRTFEWAYTYNDGHYTVWHQRSDQLAGRMGWLPEPVMTAGGRVIHAPYDDDQLWVHDARTGEVLWHTPAGRHQYVISTDGASVWLGGDRISRLSLADGETIWTVARDMLSEGDPAPSTCGRAVHCGASILVPSERALIELDADSGRLLSSRMYAEGQAPPGHLISTGTALVAIDPATVRLYPDLEHALPKALAALQAEPVPARNVLHASWLTYLSGDPAEALRLLNTPSVGAEAADEDRRAHLTVLCLLDQSARSASADERRRLCESAEAVARTPDDRLRVSSALADALSASGESAAAFRKLWTIIADLAPREDFFGADGNAIADGAARLSGRLRAIEADLDDPERHRLRTWAQSLVAQAEQRLKQDDAARAWSFLRSVAGLDFAGGGADAAWLLLGHAAVADQRYEFAESAYARVVELSQRPATTVEALIALSRLYLPDALNVPGRRVAALEQLRERFSGVALPAAHAEEHRGIRTVSDWLARQPAPRGATGLRSDGLFRLAREAGGGIEGVSEAVAFVDVSPMSDAAAFAWDEVVFLSRGNALIARRLSDGGLAWASQLALPNQPASGASPGSRDSWITTRGAVCGAALLLPDQQALHAVGLRTGKRLWSAAYRLPPVIGEPPPSGWEFCVVVGGRVAYLPTWGEAALLDVADGAPVWTARTSGTPLMALSADGGRVFALEMGLSGVHVIQADDGEVTRRIAFAGPDEDAPEIHPGPWVRAGLLVGAAPESEGVVWVGVDPDSGAERWRWSPTGEVVRALTVGTSGVGAALSEGRFVALDAGTGQVIVDAALPDGPVVGATRIGEFVLVQCGAYDGGGSRSTLAAFDAATGAPVWTREDAVMPELPEALWRECGDRLPMLLQREARSGRRGTAVDVAMVDVRTGRAVGPSLTLIESDSRERPTAGMTRRGGQLVIPTTVGVRVIDLETESESGG